MGNTQAAYGGVNADTSVSKVANMISQKIETQCASNINQTNVVKGVTLNFTNVKCKDITISSQTAVLDDPSCIDNTVQDDVASTLAASETGGTTSNQGSNTSLAGPLGINANTSYADAKVKINSYLSNKCGSDIAQANSFTEVTINASNISCDNLKVIQQASSQKVQCIVKAVQAAQDSAEASSSAGNKSSDNITAFALPIILGIVAVAVVGGLLYFHYAHHKKQVNQLESMGLMRTSGRPSAGGAMATSQTGQALANAFMRG
jgi:hypothetical protein